MNYKSAEAQLQSRKSLRNKRRGFQDKCDAKEGDVYGAGLF